MAYENLLVEQKEGGIALLALNRPKALNALNPQLLAELEAAVRAADADAATRVIVLTGAGEKAFAAGADIGAMAKMSPTEAAHYAAAGHRVLAAIEHAQKPVIAAVNGFALGGGCELAMACDLIYASDRAKFGQPEVNLGLIPGFGGCVRLPRLVGEMRAKQLTLSGEIIGADKAREIGLVLEVFPAAELLDKVFAVARTIAGRAPLAVAQAKAVINRAVECPEETALELERFAFANLFATEDTREGLAAFVEKRDARFTGR